MQYKTDLQYYAIVNAKILVSYAWICYNDLVPIWTKEELPHESSFEFVQPNVTKAAKDMKQAESKPLKVLIRIKKSKMVTCFCYIRGVTMP